MNLKETFNKEIVPQLKETLGLDNVMAVPRVTKIVVNMGVGEAAIDKKHLESAQNDLQAITGQKPVVTKARKSVASFKIRDGWPIGCKVTLRGKRMYDFLERLIHIAIPRERDFRGLNPKSFDGQGNYSMGIKEQIIFPEINYDHIDKIRGMDICINTSAKNKDEAGKDILELRAFDVSLEIGFGADLFFPLFKLSPEIRYSRGLFNMINDNSRNEYNLPIDKIIIHNISFFFTFEGGPK